MSRRDISFEAADVEELYRSGRPENWEQMLRRAEQAGGRRRRVSGPEAYDMAYALRLLAERGGAVPQTPRQCYLEMLEALDGIPKPASYPA